MNSTRPSAWLCLAALQLLAIASAADSPNALHRFWPRLPRPKTLLVVPFVGDHEEGMTFETAAGLAADALRRGKGDLMVLEQVTGNSGYEKWTRAMLEVVKPSATRPSDTWGVVAELCRRGLVKGYILFRYDTNDRPWHSTAGLIDESANVATSLAAILGGVAVSERFEPKAKSLGLPLLMDVRDKTEAWCLAQHADQFGRTVLMTADPKSRMARDLGVALRAFVVSRPGPTYEAALARCEPDCPVLGWGCGGEDEQTMASTKWGLFQTATNWSHNLPDYCTEEVGETIPAASVRAPRAGLSLADLKWESGVHYATFLLSDGDNVQWLMGNFAGGSEAHSYYESPARGRFPFGWTLCAVDLAQLCPYVLQDLFRRAAPTDDFVLYGGGYYYPDHFGESRVGHAGRLSVGQVTRPVSGAPSPPTPPLGGAGDDVMSLHASRLAAYMRALGIRSIALNAMDWDGPQAVAAYQALARNIPTLDGVFTVQYYPYSGGEGRIIWVGAPGRERPVVSCAYCIWAQTGRPRDTTPAGVAKHLNAEPVGGETWTDADFTFVMPHCWSRFRDTKGDSSLTAEEEGVDQNKETPDTARGLLPVQWCVDRLQPQVRVVTPTELLLQVRLHLRTRQTLAAWIGELRPEAMRGRSERARQLFAEAETALTEVRDGDDSGRRCFQLLRRTQRLLTPGR